MRRLMEAAAKVAGLETEARADVVRFLREEANENRASFPTTRFRSDAFYHHMAAAEDAIADLVVAAASFPAVSAGIFAVFGSILFERARQNTKWGEQNHPDVHPWVSTPSSPFEGSRPAPDVAALLHEIPTADRAKVMCQHWARPNVGHCSWTAIAVEELCEAVEQAALGDVTALRTELVQTAAVLVQWIEALDRRTGGAR